MAKSYSAAASAAKNNDMATSDSAGPSTSAPKGIQHLVLDAGPLLSLAPLRHLASSFYTTPAVLAELRDPKAREHWERLGLQGVDVHVQQPSPEAMAAVVAFAKKTGDYNVLSQTDLGVIALTYQWEAAVNGTERIRKAPGEVLPPLPGADESKDKKEDEDDGDSSDGEEVPSAGDAEGEGADVEGVVKGVDALSTSDAASKEEVKTNDEGTTADEPKPAQPTEAAEPQPAPTPAKADDDEGEWITPTNVKKRRNRDLGLLPDDKNARTTPLAAACMTGDYAVQNVLLGMGLGLVGEGGKRISRVKSYVLRCHACFKLCKDSSKRFCPSCGNATLLRATVTTSAATGKQTVHLKKNFQYRLRGTKYSIPTPQMGAAKGQKKGGSGLILREDQREWQDAVRRNDAQRVKEEKRAAKGDGSWMDPDWLPEIVTVGMSGKGRQGAHNMPAIGHGRRNPNETRRKKK